MDLGLNLGYLVAGDDPQGQLALTRRAEELGYTSVWAAEAYGTDSPTLLAWLAGQTSTIEVGSAVMQIPGRSPAMTGMTAAGLDLLSGGRFRLGLGVSGPQVSEGWHGVRFDAPLGRTREYVAIVRKVLHRDTVDYAGRHFQLPLPDGPGKALRLAVRTARPDVPIYLASVGPKNVQLAGEIADGWLGILVSADQLPERLEQLRAGAAKAGRDLGAVAGGRPFDLQASIPVVVGDDPQRCADAVRAYLALYIGGMGSREQNFYNDLAVRLGFAEEAARIQELYLSGRQRDAAAAVPFELADKVALLGDRARIADRLAELAEAGLTTCAVTPYAATLAERLAAVETVAAAAA